MEFFINRYQTLIGAGVALMVDLAILAADYESSVSHGYVRGDIPKLLLVRSARGAAARLYDMPRRASRRRAPDGPLKL